MEISSYFFSDPEPPLIVPDVSASAPPNIGSTALKRAPIDILDSVLFFSVVVEDMRTPAVDKIC